MAGAQPEWHFFTGGDARKAQRVPLRSRMDATDPVSLVKMALQGMGVVYLPRLLVKSLLDDGTLEAVLEGTGPDDLWLYAAYTQRRHNSAALKAMLAFLEDRWREI